MGRRLSRLFAGLAVAITGLFVLAVITPSVSAINFFPDRLPNGNPAPCGSASGAVACEGTGQDNISGTNGVILRAAAILSVIASIAAIIAIIVAGIMFVTAAGDSNRISTAKNTIIYSIVGLVVIFLARTIVVFVINNV